MKPGTSTSWCSRCQENLPATSFHADRTRPNGLQGNCKSCVREIRRQRSLTAQRRSESLRLDLVAAENYIRLLQEFIRENGLEPPER